MPDAPPLIPWTQRELALRAASQRIGLRCPALAPTPHRNLLLRRDQYRRFDQPNSALLDAFAPELLLRSPRSLTHLLEQREIRVANRCLMTLAGFVDRHPQRDPWLVLYWLFWEDTRLLFCGREVARTRAYRDATRRDFRFYETRVRNSLLRPWVGKSLWSSGVTTHLGMLDDRDLPETLRPFGHPSRIPYRGATDLGANIFFAHALMHV